MLWEGVATLQNARSRSRRLAMTALANCSAACLRSGMMSPNGCLPGPPCCFPPWPWPLFHLALRHAFCGGTRTGILRIFAAARQSWRLWNRLSLDKVGCLAAAHHSRPCLPRQGRASGRPSFRTGHVISSETGSFPQAGQGHRQQSRESA